MPKLEFISTCFYHGDFLQEVLPYNLVHADDYVVATEPADEVTREVCRRFGVRVLLTEDHHRNGDSFNKGRVLQRLYDQVEGHEWIVHVDSDIALPLHFRQAFFDFNDPQSDTVYGCDRVNVMGWDRWQELQASGYLRGGQWDYHYRLRFPPGYPVGVRWVGKNHGYCPIGFLTATHGLSLRYRGIHSRQVPAHHGDAARSDVQFSLQWDRKKRALLPEVIAVHLESQPAKLGANWAGRATKWFGPPGSEPAGWAEQMQARKGRSATPGASNGPS